MKRSRRSRTELTNYKETVEYLDDHLKLLADGISLFRFGPASDAKIAYLNGLVGIQSKIAMLQIDRIQRKLTEQEFARAVAKFYRVLATHIEQQPSSISFVPQVEKTRGQESPF